MRFLEETMKLFKIAFVLCLLACFAMAEDKPLARFVRVAGTAEVKVVPDQAIIAIGVEKQDPSAIGAKHAEDVAARRILATLTANGIDGKDVQTTYLSLRPETTYLKKVRVTYFVAEQTLTITVRDLPKLDSLLESLIKAGGNHIDSITYEASDLRKYRDQARELAVKAAREKAEALARALGQGIGKAQSIEEMPEANDRSPYGLYNTMVQLRTNDVTKSGPATATGQNTILASVTVSFGIELRRGTAGLNLN
jgi:uncharacterized protein YggE